ncbi:MAG: type II toxin-antitoxin system VapC family toxin [Cyclobacteriaceae bacterium]|jgi:PIN domain nuclease of toxin-antitoxin system|nr:type II toxin-antitoxin system VapC family toxin [Cyclobacteriaceae bacterium]
MNVLLDTHSLLWMAEGDNRLSVTARAEIENRNNLRFVSVASYWEMAIKLQLGKLQLKKGLQSVIDFATQLGVKTLTIDIQHIELLKELKSIHRDPFDRMLVAQATHEDLVIITIDKNIKQYPIKTIW